MPSQLPPIKGHCSLNFTAIIEVMMVERVKRKSKNCWDLIYSLVTRDRDWEFEKKECKRKSFE